MTPLTPRFFARPIHRVARDLLGRELVRPLDDDRRRARIVEVEVYEGTHDRASHASSGEATARTRPMFASPATIYVYQIYGRYQCLNIRATDDATPGAILIRAAEPLTAHAAMAVDRGFAETPELYDNGRLYDLMSGPAKLCQALRIDTSLSGRPLGEELWVEAGRPVDEAAIESTPRIGLNRETCGSATDFLWRYVIADSPWASR